ncbi:MAG: phosphate ABC transporter permease subunit PstC [Halofilum sp. (in: g-proteobacteria)]|nr:phosphate ABC transporter permease subunit PstC [Halofilum sp. (in: g-proteobacteria)]
MDTGTAIFLFLAGAAVLGYSAYHMGRAWAMQAQSAGATLHSRPHQYGWYLAAAGVLPATLAAVIAAFVQLFGWIDLVEYSVLLTAAGIAAAGTWWARRRLSPLLRARNVLDRLVRRILLAAGVVSILTTFGIVLSIIFESIRFFQLVSFWEFITGTQWSPGAAFLEAAGRGGEGGAEAHFGSVPLFAGTFMITIIAMCVALPVGLLSAIDMAEYASPHVRGIAKPVLEVLAGIPTVVYGFFAALTVAPFVVDVAGLLGLEASYNSALAAGLVMGVMIIPFISSLSDDVINSVPDAMREGSYALGTTRSETIRQILLPAALPGIISAFLLAVSRALGETMIVVMAAGMRPNLTLNPLEDMTTVTVRIVAALTGDTAFDSAETLSAFALGLVLFVITLALNLVSTILVRRFRQKYSS